MATPADTLLTISELAEQAYMPVATSSHYLRDWLPPEAVRP
jgi:hypothetical protein